jgi:adenylate kinase family enzyme
MIVNLRGTSGSGKSTLAREAIAHFGCEPQLSRKVDGYLDPARRLYVVGSYERECGGCDTIRTQDEIVSAVRWHSMDAENLLFEGAVVSTIASRYLQLADTFRGNFTFAILDTPLETCLARVRERRERKGNTKPLNTFRTVEKFNATERFARTAREKGYSVVTLDHTKALPQLLELLT